MGWAKEKEIENMEKQARRQQYLEDHPELTSNGCRYAFGGGKCTSGSNPKDYCNYDEDECPYYD